jgi:NADH dehydrogenase FAD-containing subunit
MSESTHVVVIGGGYAGVTAANRLTQRADLTVTLINPRPHFVERIRLHQLVGGSDDAVVAYADVLAERIRLVVDEVSRIDAAGRSVTLAGGDRIGYDYLIYAVGSGSADANVPGAAEFAHPIATWEAAERLRGVVGALAPGAAVTVVGAGPTGIGTAAELAGTGLTVTLVCGAVLGPYLHPRGRRAVARSLRRLGVRVLEGPGQGARVTAVTSDSVELGDGRVLPSAVTIWTAGFGVPDLATRSGLSADAVGRLRTDETLTSVDDDRIVAAGDSAAPSDRPFRMSCQAAGPLGAHSADTVLDRVAGKEASPVGLAFVGQCISLGRGAGVFQFSHRDDTALRFAIGGRAGARLKEFVCWGTVKQLSLEAAKPGLLSVPSWAADGKRRKTLRAANRTLESSAHTVEGRRVPQQEGAGR